MIEKEPNDDQAHATPFTAPMAVNGVIEKAGDVDQFVFKATQGQVYDIHCYARRIRSPLDPVMYLGKKGAGAMLGADDSVGPDSYFRFQAPETAEYVIWLVDQLGKGGPDYAYRIELTPVAPALTMTTNAEQIPLGTGVMSVAVPKGNRQAILVLGNRADFGGEVNVGVGKLPAGVTMEAPTIAASQVIVPVLFSAKADAPLASALAEITGKPADPKVDDRVAIQSDVGARAGPEPGQCLVADRRSAGGGRDRRVPLHDRDRRAQGAAGTQRLDGAQGPRDTEAGVQGADRGLSSLESAGSRARGAGSRFPRVRTRPSFPMNADGGAELRTWKIVVNGASGVASGPIMVSSQLANLTVASPYVGLAFQAASVDQGKEVDMAVKVAKAVDFAGEATVNLIGLPNKVTTDVKKITKDTTDLVFHIKTDKVSPAGNHASLFCQVVITQNGEPIVHNIGTGALRIDVPLPPKANAPAPAPVAAAPPKPAAPAAAKPLTRLEKLRLESKQAKNAGK